MLEVVKLVAIPQTGGKERLIRRVGDEEPPIRKPKTHRDSQQTKSKERKLFIEGERKESALLVVHLRSVQNQYLPILIDLHEVGTLSGSLSNSCS
jgi:hypothetical protein